ncbi:MAG: DUF116 domain-containing protein [Endomicrobia bacterium]|nr:DUF116 domain-containing protein [Endomicrobiia bacterium]
MINLYKFVFNYFVFPLSLLFSKYLSDKDKNKILNWIIQKNNDLTLKKNNKKSIKKILILLPRCLQYYECKNNVVDSIENCILCGKCKIKDISTLSKKYSNRIIVKIATGGLIAKKYVKEIMPDYVIAVACVNELIMGLKDTIDYNVVVIPNIIMENPCINTDVEIEKIKKALENII